MKIRWGWLLIFVFVLAEGFLFSSHDDTRRGSGLILLVLFFMSMFFWNGWRTALLRRRLRKEGVAGAARLIRTETTGMRSGNDPELKLFLAVTGQGGETWEASMRQIISQNELYAMAPGTLFSVLYDPQDTSKVVLDNRPQATPASVTSMQLGNANQTGNASVSMTVSSTTSFPGFPAAGDAAATTQAYQAMKAAQDAVQSRLASVGTLAKAKVLTCVPLPATINHKDPLMLLMLEIQPEDAPAFTGQVSGFIDSTHTDRYAPGCVIYVKYDPADKSQIALVGSEKPAF